MGKKDIKAFYEYNAVRQLKSKKRNRLYHRHIEKTLSFIIPENSRVLELGCGSGDLLDAVSPSYGVGIDFVEEMVRVARDKHPGLVFYQMDAEDIQLNEKFDYIIVSDLVGVLWDVQKMFKELHKVVHPGTRIVFTYYNTLWEPVIKLAEFLRLKRKQPVHNWLTLSDLENLLHLEDFQLINSYGKLLVPQYVPLINLIFNTFLGNLPLINRLTITRYMIARPEYKPQKDYSTTIVVPARNEKGNIENAILKTPAFGSHQEFLFMEGNSSDGTYQEMQRVQNKYTAHDIKVYRQTGKGKGNAVREAFDKASCDILMILDADLTTPPEDMYKFYEAIKRNKGEFINGSRLVYPMEKQAMRFLNRLGNTFFGFFFTHLLDQKIKDTLCGTKVLFRSDYQKIKQNRSYFGDFDPFGDFDLLFGAAKLNLKITEIIVRYRSREYGQTQISRFRHGFLLLKMSLFAARKIKFR